MENCKIEKVKHVYQSKLWIENFLPRRKQIIFRRYGKLNFRTSQLKRVMKSILLLSLLFFCVHNSFSQEEDEYFVEDSVHLSQFLKQVDYIELCELGLTCYMDSTYVDDSDERKWVQKCYLGGAIRHPGIDFSKITYKKQAKEMNSFFQVFISSTKNTVHTKGICYEPRNGILFFDKEKKLIAYMEICFQCGNTYTLKELGSVGFTSEQYAELEYLFNQNGLKTK